MSPVPRARSARVPQEGADRIRTGEIEAEVNRRHLTGDLDLLRISSDPSFVGGEPNPCPCKQTPSRVHRLLEC